MVLGLTSTLILLLALPGFVFRRFYYTGEYYKQYSSSKIILTTFWSLIIGVFITFPSVILYNRIAEYFSLFLIERDSLIEYYCWIFVESDAEALYSSMINAIFDDKHLFSVVGMASTFFGVSALLGITFQYIVRKLFLDVQIGFLSFQNYWSYYLRGRKILFDRDKLKTKRTATKVSLVINTGESCLAKIGGTLMSYELGHSTKSLEAIVLKDIAVDADSAEVQVAFKEFMAGQQSPEHEDQVMVIPYDRVRAITIHLLTKKVSFDAAFRILVLLQPFFLIAVLVSPFSFNWAFFTSNPYTILGGAVLGFTLLLIVDGIKNFFLLKVIQKQKKKAWEHLTKMTHAILGLGGIYVVLLILFFLFDQLGRLIGLW